MTKKVMNTIWGAKFVMVIRHWARQFNQFEFTHCFTSEYNFIISQNRPLTSICVVSVDLITSSNTGNSLVISFTKFTKSQHDPTTKHVIGDAV